MNSKNPVTILIFHQKYTPELTIQPTQLNQLQTGFGQIKWKIVEKVEHYFDAMVEAQIIWSNVFPIQYPANMSKLQWYQTTTTHTGGTIPEIAFQKKLTITNSRSVYAQNASEMVMGYLLSLAKQFSTLWTAQQNKHWMFLNEFTEKHRIQSLNGKKLGILGFGAIGQATAKKAKYFGMKVLASDIRKDLPISELDGFYLNDPSPIFSESDFVLISIPSCSQTKGLVNDRLLAQMKETACLINLSPASVLDEDYLYNMLKYKDVPAAILDCTNLQPLPPIHPLYQLDNIFITPHVACYDEQILEKLVDHFATNLKYFLAGKPLNDPIINYDYP